MEDPQAAMSNCWQDNTGLGEFAPQRAGEAFVNQRIKTSTFGRPTRKWSIDASRRDGLQELPSEASVNALSIAPNCTSKPDKSKDSSRVEKVWEKLERTLKLIDQKKSMEVVLSSELGNTHAAFRKEAKAEPSDWVNALSEKLNLQQERRSHARKESSGDQFDQAESLEGQERHSLAASSDNSAPRKQWQLVYKHDSAFSQTESVQEVNSTVPTLRAEVSKIPRSSVTSLPLSLTHRPQLAVASEKNSGNEAQYLETKASENSESVDPWVHGAEPSLSDRLVLQKVDGRLRWTPEGAAPENENKGGSTVEIPSQKAEAEEVVVKIRGGIVSECVGKLLGAGPVERLDEASSIRGTDSSGTLAQGRETSTAGSLLPGAPEGRDGTKHASGKDNEVPKSVSHELLRLTSVAEGIRLRAAGGISSSSTPFRRPEAGTSAMRVARSMQEAQGLVLGAIRKQRELGAQSTPVPGRSKEGSIASSPSPIKESEGERMKSESAQLQSSLGPESEKLGRVDSAGARARKIVESSQQALQGNNFDVETSTRGGWEGDQMDSEVVIRIQMRSPRGRHVTSLAEEGDLRGYAKSERRETPGGLEEGKGAQVARNGLSGRADDGVNKRAEGLAGLRGGCEIGGMGCSRRGEEVAGNLEERSLAVVTETARKADEIEAKDLQQESDLAGRSGEARTSLEGEVAESAKRSESVGLKGMGREDENRLAGELIGGAKHGGRFRERSTSLGEQKSERGKKATGLGGTEEENGIDEVGNVQQRVPRGESPRWISEKRTSLGAEHAQGGGADKAVGLQAVETHCNDVTDVWNRGEREYGSALRCTEQSASMMRAFAEKNGGLSEGQELRFERSLSSPVESEDEGPLRGARDFFTPRGNGVKTRLAAATEGQNVRSGSTEGIACDGASALAENAAGHWAGWSGSEREMNGSDWALQREAEPLTAVGDSGGSDRGADVPRMTLLPVGNPTALVQPAVLSGEPFSAQRNAPGSTSGKARDDALVTPLSNFSGTREHDPGRRLSLENLPLDGERAGFAARARAWRERLGTCAGAVERGSCVHVSGGAGEEVRLREGPELLGGVGVLGRGEGVPGEGGVLGDRFSGFGAGQSSLRENVNDRKGFKSGRGASEAPGPDREEASAEDKRVGREAERISARPVVGSHDQEIEGESQRGLGAKMTKPKAEGDAGHPGGAAFLGDTESKRQEGHHHRLRRARKARHPLKDGSSGGKRRNGSHSGRSCSACDVRRERKREGKKQSGRSPSVSGESSGRSRPSPLVTEERSGSFSPRCSRFFEAAGCARRRDREKGASSLEEQDRGESPDSSDREEWKEGPRYPGKEEKENGLNVLGTGDWEKRPDFGGRDDSEEREGGSRSGSSSSGDNFVRGRSGSRHGRSVERNRPESGLAVWQKKAPKRERGAERRGRSITPELDRSRQRSRRSASPSYDRRAAQRSGGVRQGLGTDEEGKKVWDAAESSEGVRSRGRQASRKAPTGKERSKCPVKQRGEETRGAFGTDGDGKVCNGTMAESSVETGSRGGKGRRRRKARKEIGSNQRQGGSPEDSRTDTEAPSASGTLSGAAESEGSVGVLQNRGWSFVDGSNAPLTNVSDARVTLIDPVAARKQDKREGKCRTASISSLDVAGRPLAEALRGEETPGQEFPSVAGEGLGTGEGLNGARNTLRMETKQQTALKVSLVERADSERVEGRDGEVTARCVEKLGKEEAHEKGGETGRQSGQTAVDRQPPETVAHKGLSPGTGPVVRVSDERRVDARVFLSSAGRLRAAAQQVRACVEVGENARLQELTRTILAICEEAALAALQAAGHVVGAETNWSPSDSMVLFTSSAAADELTT